MSRSKKVLKMGIRAGLRMVVPSSITGSRCGVPSPISTLQTLILRNLIC